MKPMGNISTPFISYHDINVDETDLYEDAWGFAPQYCDVIEILNQLKPAPGKRLMKRVIASVREKN
jgi:hypothetical protein